MRIQRLFLLPIVLALSATVLAAGIPNVVVLFVTTRRPSAYASRSSA